MVLTPPHFGFFKIRPNPITVGSGVINVDEMEMRSDPNPTSSRLYLAHRGDNYEIIEIQGEWVYVIGHGKIGWIPARFIDQS